jgi:hypothetical protein
MSTEKFLIFFLLSCLFQSELLQTLVLEPRVGVLPGEENGGGDYDDHADRLPQVQSCREP